MLSSDRDDDDDRRDELQFTLELECSDRTAPHTSDKRDLVGSNKQAANIEFEKCETLNKSRVVDAKRAHKEKESKQ
jgi:hypothetical protein